MSNLDARSRWLALYVLCLASLMIVLDVTIVGRRAALDPATTSASPRRRSHGS